MPKLPRNGTAGATHNPDSAAEQNWQRPNLTSMLPQFGDAALLIVLPACIEFGSQISTIGEIVNHLPLHIAQVLGLLLPMLTIEVCRKLVDSG